jgi:hypothetical protein
MLGTALCGWSASCCLPFKHSMVLTKDLVLLLSWYIAACNSTVIRIGATQQTTRPDMVSLLNL